MSVNSEGLAYDTLSGVSKGGPRPDQSQVAANFLFFSIIQFRRLVTVNIIVSRPF